MNTKSPLGGKRGIKNMTREEASRVLKLKMEIHKQMFEKDIDEPLKTAYEMAIDCLDDVPPVQPDKEKISNALYHIYLNTSPHTSADGVVAIKYHIAEIWREIYGEEGPKWMTQ